MSSAGPTRLRLSFVDGAHAVTEDVIDWGLSNGWLWYAQQHGHATDTVTLFPPWRVRELSFDAPARPGGPSYRPPF